MNNQPSNNRPGREGEQRTNRLDIKTKKESNIESCIEEEWEHYGHINDSEYAVVIGIRWPDDEVQEIDPETELVRWSMYFCKDDLVNRVRVVNSWRFNQVNNLADAATKLLEEIAEQDKREPLEAVRDYWNQPADKRETY